MCIDPVQFIADIAWPVAIVLVALLYRRPLTKLISGDVTSFRVGPFAFEQAWDQAKSSVENTRGAREPAAPRLRSTASTPSYDGLLGGELSKLAESDPRAAVLRAYETVRLALQRGIAETDLEIDVDALDALGLVRAAESHGVVPPAVTDAVLGLSVLHNLAVHAPSRDMSPGRACEYLAMADAAIYAFASAAKNHIDAKSLETAA